MFVLFLFVVLFLVLGDTRHPVWGYVRIHIGYVRVHIGYVRIHIGYVRVLIGYVRAHIGYVRVHILPISDETTKSSDIKLRVHALSGGLINRLAYDTKQM